jgi:glycosyltransferase involved in cell wall biosynthesis
MNKKNPLVSVAIITYNQKKFLKECIESILAQNYSNIEIVIGDDASTDGTQEMLKEYEKKYPGKFKLVLHKTNQGITKNSNSVLKKCKGKYIAWMGGDDLMLPEKIRKQVEFMEKNLNCTICYHNLEVFDSDTGKILSYFNDEKNIYEGNIKTTIKYGTFNGACSSMVRRDKSAVFDETLPVASDWLYWIDTLANGGEIRYIDEVLGRYRRHHNNVTRDISKLNQNIIDHLNSINILLKKYPQYKDEIFFRASFLYRGLRFKIDYKTALKLSFAYKMNLKSLIGLFLYYLSLGRIKK